MLHPGVQPTPVLAWSITGIDAAAGVVVTASHNPPADNGYKVYLDDRLADRAADRHGDLGLHRRSSIRSTVDLAAADDPLIERLDGTWVDRVRRVRPRRCACDRRSPGVRVAYTAMHGVGGAVLLRAFEARRLRPHRSSSPSSRSPTARSRPCAFPNPEEPGAMDLLLATAAGRAAPSSRSPTTPTPIGSARRSRSRTARGGGSAATRSAGCSPITSSPTRPATTVSS